MERDQDRSCGDCSACCKTHGIRELNKPAGDWCSHCSSEHNSCTIYTKRPPSCAAYKCLWLLTGAGGEAGRPKNSGIVIDLIDAFERNGVANILKIYEVESGDLIAPMIQDLLAALIKERTVLFVVRDANRRVVEITADRSIFSTPKDREDFLRGFRANDRYVIVE